MLEVVQGPLCYHSLLQQHGDKCCYTHSTGEKTEAQKG